MALTTNNKIAIGLGCTTLLVTVIGWFVNTQGSSSKVNEVKTSPCSIATAGQSGGTNTVNCDKEKPPKLGIEIETKSVLTNDNQYQTRFHVSVGFSLNSSRVGKLEITPATTSIKCMASETPYPKIGKGGAPFAGGIKRR